MSDLQEVNDTSGSTDGAAVEKVLAAVLVCAQSWVPEARIIGNVRAGDIARAIKTVLSAEPAGAELETVAYLIDCFVEPALEFADVHVPDAAIPLVRKDEAIARIQELTAANEELGRERDELVTANNAIEIDAGLTSDGNLWRFWAKKAREVSDKRKADQASIGVGGIKGLRWIDCKAIVGRKRVGMDLFGHEFARIDYDANDVGEVDRIAAYVREKDQEYLTVLRVALKG